MIEQTDDRHRLVALQVGQTLFTLADDLSDAVRVDRSARGPHRATFFCYGETIAVRHIRR
jgi:hypothetical protein